jgi:hypothetical protein
MGAAVACRDDLEGAKALSGIIGTIQRDMRRHLLVACAAVALLVVACGGDDPKKAAPQTAPSPVASAIPTTVSSAPPTEIPGASSPDEAALGFYGAWLEGDTAGAGVFATPQAVNELFAHQASEIQFNSCSRAGSKYRCFFYYEGGGLNMNVEGNPTSGYLVTKAFFIAD